MNTEIFIEGFPLDINTDIATLLTLAIDDVKDFSSRQTTFSKTVVLPGTSRNNDLFGNIFDTGQANAFNAALDNVGYNFNAAKAARCLIFQDQIQTFKGTLRLLEIIKDKGNIEYEVALNGELTTLNVALSAGYLTDLDFSAYDHVYNAANIIASWDNPGGSGVYYPTIDYGTYSVNKHDWDIRTFRPALYDKEYVDKMFSAANFRYTCDLFNTSRFKKLITPHNQKKLQRSTSEYITANVSVSKQLIFNPGDGSDPIDFSTMQWDTANTASNFTNLSNLGWQYNQPGSINIRIRCTVSGVIAASFAGFDVYFGLAKNLTTSPIPPDWTTKFVEYITVTNVEGVTTPFSHTFDISLSLVENDTFEFFAASPDTTGPSGAFYLFQIDTASLIVDSQSATLVDVAIGDTVQMNVILPKNVRQIDFLVSIVKLFNLYVYESQFDERLILIKPFVDFYSEQSSNAVDWTYKLNRDQPIKIKPLSELNSKLYNFNYKDDSDYYNDQYKKRWNQGYGSYIFDSEFEFVSQTSKLELVFAATPLVGYIGEDKIYPTIFKRSGTTEETIDSVIRIMQSKKVMGVTNWTIKDGATVLATTSNYGYAGHFDDPDSPVNDLNFGVLNELYFTLVTGNLTNTQFNVYWSAYMAEITSKDSKMLTGKFYLTPKDIFDLNFARYIFLDGVLWRLNKITDYNASQPSDCQVELLKVINTTYSFPPLPPPDDGEHFLLWTDDNPLIDSDTQEILYV